MADKLSQFSHAYALSKQPFENMKQTPSWQSEIVFVLLAGVLGGIITWHPGMFHP
ncbi:hypothetical protein [Lentibacillus sp. CBA3610]|uniref:hypothetical protein n=1 Tax=Lentibacillus sp. CBA3610 TaxID=2518176 RepID=UPI001595EA53|nr:hypothetical protein [Lentibacillus sp. CBA3610]